MNSKEMEEVRIIEKEDALERVAGIVKAYDLTRNDVLQIVPDERGQAAASRTLAKARPFDPFLDLN